MLKASDKQILELVNAAFKVLWHYGAVDAYSSSLAFGTPMLRRRQFSLLTRSPKLHCNDSESN